MEPGAIPASFFPQFLGEKNSTGFWADGVCLLNLNLSLVA
jgi:hypothetical protein